jgi:peptide/nickel transport system permease protein
MAFALLGVSMPSFWLGLNLILLFALVLGWFPTAGYSPLSHGVLETVRHLLLPAVALGFSQTAVIARMTRSTLMEVMQEDYVRTARAKGLRERFVIVKHALRNAMVPTLGVIGISVALLLGGAIIIEKVFTLPGVGSLVVNSILRRDFPVIQGILMVIAFIVAVVNLGVDIMYAILDPRIRYN